MSVILARVDQRLIHGIVVNQWAAETQAGRYMVIDDEVSKNENLKASMRLSKPVGTGMSIIDTEKAIRNFKNGNYDKQRVFVIVKEPSTLIKLLDAGIEIPKVTVGIIFNENGRKNISKFVSVNDEEVKDFKEIEKRKVPCVIQYVPNDSEENINKFI
ncbi:phosphoenolpyruvate-dependent sugar phosphotransferase system EIIB, probable sorbose specific [Pediococcus damnosus]|uniref:Phosphoenolpyruvate-dependent sugar phosphotransferase system EIIB, probable sorbose specific n=1 Tax=Pediococcus damnosus TaxID=51663 RepID=A0A0R2HFD9_9LACO|nr:PTS sugar transporter subunit IIB [Pediococcus damnosus]AMV60368.1 phosphoenolpyruvate-dependent sugar phosphotransferase system EIIB, probable sorbose specific [Pediococcus damnosus]AMV63230.1 phosphoenolpyruvate-dependent sugar phosphotransferase system EIIB, probable sorbose specific [Pediococcus damnosus]AMV64618.1 phosphoenolpyruvate-dependent sugar phosphotransferase system EIIB, probable sorbose specific [Pediococcus damnosus]AMV66873.1 phosphoenolpyruvate-dependent sugar phosphotrans